MQNLLTKKGFLCDMDGVIYHGNRLLPGVQEFVAWLQKEHKKFLFLTNNSGKTQRELQSKLSRMGLDIDEKHFYTSGLDTVLVLSGVTSQEEIGHFPYRPRLVLKGVGEIPAAKGLPSAASACIIDKDPGQVPQGAPDSKGQPPCLKGAAK